MPHYLLSTYAAQDDADPPGPPAPPADMQRMMTAMIELEEDMIARGNFAFSGRLHTPDAATVVTADGGNVVMTDGPFVEAKEHIAGFYIIEADDLDVALAWAARVAECIGRPIEVQPFAATGRMADHLPDAAR
ncbi:MAG: YciI family protein [Acidimicrobiales bacterium]